MFYHTFFFIFSSLICVNFLTSRFIFCWMTVFVDFFPLSSNFSRITGSCVCVFMFSKSNNFVRHGLASPQKCYHIGVHSLKVGKSCLPLCGLMKLQLSSIIAWNITYNLVSGPNLAHNCQQFGLIQAHTRVLITPPPIRLPSVTTGPPFLIRLCRRGTTTGSSWGFCGRSWRRRSCREDASERRNQSFFFEKYERILFDLTFSLAEANMEMMERQTASTDRAGKRRAKYGFLHNKKLLPSPVQWYRSRSVSITLFNRPVVCTLYRGHK